jgi:2-oxoglutarate ferredoxin oxidoreductase subunit alpha
VESVLRGFRRILVPENNSGQLANLLRSRFLLPVVSLPKVEGRPFFIRELRNAIEENLKS